MSNTNDGFVEVDCSPPVGKRKKPSFVEKAIEQEDGMGMEVIWRIWNLKLENYTTAEISRKVRLPVQEVNRLLWQCFQAFKDGMAESAQIVKEQDLQRTEILLQGVMKLAGLDGVILRKMVSGEPVEASDAHLPLKAADTAIRIMAFRAKLLGIDTSLEQLPNPNKAMNWLEGEMVRINQIVAAQPVELVIECEAEKLP